MSKKPLSNKPGISFSGSSSKDIVIVSVFILALGIAFLSRKYFFVLLLIYLVVFLIRIFYLTSKKSQIIDGYGKGKIDGIKYEEWSIVGFRSAPGTFGASAILILENDKNNELEIAVNQDSITAIRVKQSNPNSKIFSLKSSLHHNRVLLSTSVTCIIGYLEKNPNIVAIIED